MSAHTLREVIEVRRALLAGSPYPGHHAAGEHYVRNVALAGGTLDQTALWQAVADEDRGRARRRPSRAGGHNSESPPDCAVGGRAFSARQRLRHTRLGLPEKAWTSSGSAATV